MSNEIKVSKFTVISKTGGDTITVETFGDGIFIRNDFYGTATFTKEKAEQDALFKADNFGIYRNAEDSPSRNDISGPIYKLAAKTTEPTPPAPEPAAIPSGSGNTAMLNDDAQTKITGIIKDKAEIEMSTYYTTTVSPQARAQKRGETFIAAGFTFRNGDTEETQKEIWNDLYNDIAEQIYRADIRENESNTQPPNTSTQPEGSSIIGTGVGTGTDLEFVKIAAKNAANRDAQEKANVKGGRVVSINVISEEPQLLSVSGNWKVTTTVSGNFIKKQTVEDKYPSGYKATNITFEYTQVDPDRPKPETPPPTPPKELTPPKDAVKKEQVKYQPKTRVSEPKSTAGGEYIEKESGKDYVGPYVQAYKNKYYAGSNLDQNGVELVPVPVLNFDSRQVAAPALTFLFQAIKGFFNKKATSADRQRGRTMRYFMQRKKDNKIVELDKDNYQQAQQIAPSQNFAQVDWIIKGPAEDQNFNGYPFEGAASKNKKAIQALESQMPGISKFVTDYAFLVEEPVNIKDNVIESRTTVIPDPDKQLENDRKANFDLRK
jgi:hypothetical protein